MTDRVNRPVTVGTYVNEELAETAAGYLRDSDIDGVEVVKVADGVWQVQVPWELSARAVAELRPHEQWAMQARF